MGKELELNLNEKSSEGLSPNTVLPPQEYCVNVKRRSKKGKSSGKDEVFTLKEDFAEIKFARFRSSSCKSSRLSRSHGLEGNNDIETRRVSMYQSSEEVKNGKKMGGRKKIEFSRRSDISLSSSIVDSLCGSDDEDSNHRPSDISQYSNYSSRSSACHEPDNSNGFFEICMHSDVKNKKSTAVEGRGSVNLKSRSDKVADSIMNGNFLHEKEKIHSLQKSLSAKVEASYLLSPSLESDCSAKVRFTPVRKKTKNFIKSKSLRSPLSHIAETNEEVNSNETSNIMINRTYQKYLLNDLSNSGKHSDIISEFINRDIKYSGIASSPVHLHGNLKLENKQGMPFFEFKVKCPEDVFVAKTWRIGNGFNFVYTFHSIDNRKKSNATGMESHDFDKDSSIVAKMLVSSNLCSEIKEKSDNSMVTEFVLYDLSHSRHSVSSEKKSLCEQNVFKTRKASRVGPKEEASEMVEENLAVKNKLLGKSNSFSLLPTESSSDLEIAAIVLEIPFSKRESLKYKRGDRLSAKEHSNLSNLCAVVDQSRKSLHDRKFQEQLKVVIPTGYHGLPNAECRGPLPNSECRGPSPLLDRLRHGGGCDCGGWDMACPLVLLGNPSIQFAEDHSLIEEYQPLELFVQGAKESNPTFSMKMVEEGHYAIDFHAQLSTLQAFSICVAILHGTSASSGPGNEKNQQQLSKCSSLKMLLEDNVERLFKSITTEKNTACNSPKGIPRSYVPNPPFSPIARV